MIVSQTLTLTVSNTISEISVSVISIPEDRLENILLKHVRKIEQSKDIIGSSGLFAALLTTLLTSDFRDAGLSSDVWKGVFFVALLASFVYMLRVLWNLFKNKSGVDKIMADIKSAKSEMCYIGTETNTPDVDTYIQSTEKRDTAPTGRSKRRRKRKTPNGLKRQ